MDEVELMRTRQQLDEEQKSWDDWSDRVARNDPDWRYYPPGTTRPRFPSWRRVLKI